MNNTDKQGLRNSTVAIKSKIIVKATTDKPEIVLTESDYIKDWEYTDDRYVPQKGFIGQFVARTLSGNLHNVSEDFNIENREIELQLGIVHLGEDSEPSWYSLGNFLITNPKDDEVRDNTKFEAMDYAKLFNKTFDGSYTDTLFTTSYNTKMENKETVTALWLARYVCAQVNIELGNTDFVNSDYVIDINPFRNNETCRDVIKEVAKLAYSWVRIDWDNKCYIDFSVKENSSVDEYDIFTSDHYYTLETKKEKYGPINNVVVGMSNVDGESHSNPDNNSIAQNGEHAIYIYDNPLTYTFEHRERANAKGNCLFGLSYAHMTCETIGFPWLRGNELISILDMENNPIYTYPFNKKITFNGHIKSTIDSMGESEVEETLAYESNVVKNARNAFINVNKQEGEIQILSQNIQNVEKEINPPENASDSEIIVEDASNNPLLYLEVEGKSTQETRSGHNLIDTLDTLTLNGLTITRNKDHTFVINGTRETLIVTNVIKQVVLPAGTYNLSVKFNDNETQADIYYDVNGEQVYLYKQREPLTFTLEQNSTILSVQPYFGVRTYNNETLSVQLVSGSSPKPYEQYGAMPSPDYPSEIKSVGYENLLDIEDGEYTGFGNVKINVSNGVVTINGNSTSTGTIYINPNFNLVLDGTYALSINKDGGSISGSNMAVCLVKDDDIVFSRNQTENVTVQIFNEQNCNKIGLYINSGTTFNNFVIKPMLLKGTQQHNYIPYGKYGIEVETVGKNRWDNKNATTTSTVLNVTDTGFNYERGAETGGRFFANKFNLKANKTYTFSILDNSNVPLYIYKDNVYGTSLKSGYNSITYTPSEDVEVYATIIIGSGVTSAIVEEIQFEERNAKTKFEPYQKNTLLMILNSPPKSLPNGVKNIAYIKNNRLYVDHYVGSVVLDGSDDEPLKCQEIISDYNKVVMRYTTALNISETVKNDNLLSNYFTADTSVYNLNDKTGFYVNTNGLINFVINLDTIDATVDSTTTECLSLFKTWLSTNNVQVDYELAEPYTEEIGEIETLKTLLGYNKITTTDDLQPTLNITYVRDTVLADYVENHIAELKINEEQISQRVETIDTSVDGLQTDISRVEQITTDTSQVLNIVSTNIDKTTGDVNAVTTKQKKFTFNDEGLKISAGENGFNSVQDETGTYYYDGNAKVGEYTKDGSKQKDLELFGTYSYGKKDIEDTPMFVGQLYTDENGDEGFGHFVNI